jgi:LuxR family transcriptional regulator, maltose regulon positive regulatory protein
MVTPILATKLYVPPPRPQFVPRPRLIEQLNEGLKRKPGMTLISAPAGFGKTTLVSEWVNQKTEGGTPLERRGQVRKDPAQRTAGLGEIASSIHSLPFRLQPFKVAWLSLDEGDSDPARFLAYLVAALQTIAANVGAGALGALQMLPPPPAESILTALLNDITAVPDPFVLVLDDYHVIDAKPVDKALTFLLEHLPPLMHLVITTREDPQLPLARLRARGQLTELRAADLRFTAAEAAEFLNPVMGLSLSAADIAALEERTEGWIAGLQLAALSMQGRQDVPGFIRAFAGDHRYIADYLVEEVLQRQPEPIRNFLLQTAILDRLNGPLCEAVTGQENGSARLAALERGNFFVVPLDDQRQWYRYHHLFAEVLRAHLMAEQPDQVSTLHRRASEWFERNGSVAEAIRHALAAKDFERAADLIERAVPAMSSSRQEAAVLGWLKALPDELITYRPVLSVHFAWALLTSGELEGVEARLRDAERWLDTEDRRQEAEGRRQKAVGSRHELAKQVQADASATKMVVVDEEEFRRLPGSIAVFRAAQAQARADVPETVKYARRALELIPEDDHLWRGAAASLLGLAWWTSGDLEAAYQSYAEGMARMQRAGHPSDALGCAIALADIRIAQGRLHEALRTYEQALPLGTVPGGPVLRGTADLYVGLSEIRREQNDLEAATQHLLRSQALGEIAGLPQNRYRGRVAMARIRQAQGDLDGALDLLGEAERHYVSDFFPNVRPVAALKTRVWITQGRLSEALGWVNEQGLSAEDHLTYLREYEHITLARVLLARYPGDRANRSMDEAVGLLDRLLPAAEAGGRTGSVIEILVLRALAHQAQGDLPAALVPLERALTLAEPEGYVRMFVDEGPSLAALLGRMKGEGGRMKAYVHRLLATFGTEGDIHPSSFILQPLIEPLTGRELELLRLLGTNLTGPEIARQLTVSLNTMRTHTKNIYTKLGVNDRGAAVRRAEELGLL